MKKLILFSSLSVFALFVPYHGWTQEPQNIHTPVITHVYAPAKGVSGTNVKVYIEAEDAGGDMVYIDVILDRTGYGSSTPDRVLLDPRHQRHLKGFIEWSRAGAGLPEGTQLTARIFIHDRAGNTSNQVVLPFTFVSRMADQEEVSVPSDWVNVPRIGYMGVPQYEPGPF